jgi:hypothetical protein
MVRLIICSYGRRDRWPPPRHGCRPTGRRAAHWYKIQITKAQITAADARIIDIIDISAESDSSGAQRKAPFRLGLKKE